MSRAGTRWQAKRLSDTVYLEAFRDFVRHTNQHHHGTEVLLSALKEVCTSRKRGQNLRWLSVGTGLGDWELDILRRMHSELSGVIVDELEAFEVNPVTFQSLEKAFAERSSLPVRKVNLHNSAFTAQTALIEKYHIMTLSHVLYYFTTPSQRRDVLKHLCSHLQEGGTLVILHSGKSKSDDVPDHQIMLSSTFGPRIDKGDGKAFLPADWSLYDGEQILQETENLLPSGIKASCQQYRYDITVPLPHAGVDGKKQFSNIIGFLLACDVRSLPEECLNEVAQWVVRQGQPGKDDHDHVSLSQTGTVIVFKRTSRPPPESQQAA